MHAMLKLWLDRIARNYTVAQDSLDRADIESEYAISLDTYWTDADCQHGVPPYPSVHKYLNNKVYKCSCLVCCYDREKNKFLLSMLLQYTPKFLENNCTCDIFYDLFWDNIE